MSVVSFDVTIHIVTDDGQTQEFTVNLDPQSATWTEQRDVHSVCEYEKGITPKLVDFVSGPTSFTVGGIVRPPMAAS